MSTEPTVDRTSGISPFLGQVRPLKQTMRRLRPTASLACAATLMGCALFSQHRQAGARSSEPLPPQMEECETHTARVCGIWTRTAGGFRAMWSQGSVASIEVVRFDSDSVVLLRADPSGSSEGMAAEYRGAIRAPGYVVGTVVWRRLGVTSRGAWVARWRAPMARGPVHNPPPRIRECETHTARVCGTWRRSSSSLYSASWSQRSAAKIEVYRFDRDSVAFVRNDPTGSSRGMHAEYLGARSGERSAAGVVTWTHGGSTFSGRWEAEW
jgi:hypothetical protein